MTNLINVDFASQDKRSISAMLRGRGDGRERLWSRYAAKHHVIEMEQLMADYAKACTVEKPSMGANQLLQMMKAGFAFGVILLIVF